MSNTVVGILRIIHIVAGAAWFGSVFLFVFFLEPSSRALGPEGAPFMRELIGKRKLVRMILWLGAITITAGLILYTHLTNAYGGGDLWATPIGKGLTIGGTSALIAFLFGFFGTRPNVKKLMAASAKVAASEGPPPPELLAEVGTIQKKLRMFARIAFGFLTLAVISMAVARYL